LVPGIAGSVLQKRGHDLWAISGQAAWRALTSLGRTMQDLILESPSGDVDDGIRAVRLMADAHLVPGLVKVDGYTRVSRFLTNSFEVVQRSVDDPEPGNFFGFPYDWRQDNRITGRNLEVFVGHRLQQWRDYSGVREAKVILVAHSMGGLASRYYLEVLEGWADCRALITFGTPYRGSLDAVGYLANGYKRLFVDLTEAMRSFPSVHQLLPIYPAIAVNGNYYRPAELPEVAQIAIDSALAADALAFHREIEAAVARHRDDEDYRRTFKTIPFVGTNQPTKQSAVYEAGVLEVREDLPEGIDPLLGDGDGTVPRLSAIPIELSEEYRETFVAERHSSLQNHPGILDDLRGRLEQMQVVGLGDIRGPEISGAAERRAAISVEVDDAYTSDEAVRFTVDVKGPDRAAATLEARIEPIGPAGNAWSDSQTLGKEPWSPVVDLEPGLYRLTVATASRDPGSPDPVHDLFEVVGAMP
jgi:pimeloyl-ACP methyl ester carboxylesterase